MGVEVLFLRHQGNEGMDEPRPGVEDTAAELLRELSGQVAVAVQFRADFLVPDGGPVDIAVFKDRFLHAVAPGHPERRVRRHGLRIGRIELAAHVADELIGTIVRTPAVVLARTGHEGTGAVPEDGEAFATQRVAAGGHAGNVARSAPDDDFPGRDGGLRVLHHGRRASGDLPDVFGQFGGGRHLGGGGVGGKDDLVAASAVAGDPGLAAAAREHGQTYGRDKKGPCFQHD